MDKIATLSFDDNINDALTVVVLKRLGVTATFYLCSDYLSAACYNGLKRSEIASMYDGFEVGAHSKNHFGIIDYKKILDSHVSKSIVADGIEEVSSFFDQKTNCYAYPFGLVTPAEWFFDQIKYARTIEIGGAFGCDPLQQKITGVLNGEMMEKIQSIEQRGKPVHLIGHSYKLDVAELAHCVRVLQESGYEFLKNYEYFEAVK